MYYILSIILGILAMLGILHIIILWQIRHYNKTHTYTYTGYNVYHFDQEDYIKGYCSEDEIGMLVDDETLKQRVLKVGRIANEYDKLRELNELYSRNNIN